MNKETKESPDKFSHIVSASDGHPNNAGNASDVYLNNVCANHKKTNIRNLEKDLWESADLLRQGSKLTSNQYCMPVLGLIFLRFAYGRYKHVEAEILKDRPMRGGHTLPVEPNDFIAKNALYLPKEAQYDYLVNLPENIAAADLKNKDGHTMNSLGEVVNNAMHLIEAQSEQLSGVLPKTYTDFTDDILAELLRIFNNQALDDPDGDIIGRVYEYFLNKFSSAVASDDGVFFTPKSLVKMIVNVLEPKFGTLLDPACGSGGMFVQSGDFVNSHGMHANSSMTFYGQEKVEYNAQLCLMNIAVHGLTGIIKSGNEANTFYHDAFLLDGKCDYVMANPPFNVDKIKAELCQAAGRLPLGLPAINKKEEFGNGNYLWINYFYSYLNDHGRAGFVMASSATDSQGKEKLIREKLVKTGDVDVMISVGNNFFYTKSLPCTLWFFDKNKTNAIKDKILFIDARNYFTVVDRTFNEWSTWQLKNLNAIVWLYRGQTDRYKELIEEYHHVLGSEKPFSQQIDELKENIKSIKDEAKIAVKNAERRDKKKVQAQYDKKIADVNEFLIIAKEADWLYSKFAEGKYKDIPGLCKIAYNTDDAKKAATLAINNADDNSEDKCSQNLSDMRVSVEEKGWSLTPGAYVGVAPVEDDGVDFEERMHEIHEELLSLQAESNELMSTISKNMKEMGL